MLILVVQGLQEFAQGNPEIFDIHSGICMRSLLVEEVVVDLEIAIVGRGAFGPWWFNGGLQWYKVKHHLKQIQVFRCVSKLRAQYSGVLLS